MTPITNLLDNGYDDIVTFGRVLSQSVFGCNVDSLLDYFEAPHKWETEYQKWRELGGTLDDECLERFAAWYEDGDQR